MSASEQNLELQVQARRRERLAAAVEAYVEPAVKGRGRGDYAFTLEATITVDQYGYVAAVRIDASKI